LSAPVIWIGFPAIIAVILWLIRKNERMTLLTGLGASLFFIISAVVTPVGKPIIQIGTFAVQITSSIGVLGRTFTLTTGDLVFTTFIYIILFLFLCMSFVIEIPEKFVPISFLLTAIIIAALSVQPFLYAALLLELAVLLSILLLSVQGQLPTPGVMRFLIFQSLAMPFMLAAGWVLSAVEANPTEGILVIQALGLIGLGFSFWLAVFPFNSWMPQLAGEKPSFVVGFILILFNSAILILVMRYLDGFVWLRDDARIFIVLRFLGILMLFSSSILFLAEKNINRTIAYLISFETGMSLLALSINQSNGWNAFTLMFIPRILCISLWSVALTYLQQNSTHEETTEKTVIHPLVVSSFTIAGLSIAGFPLLPGFINRISIYGALASQDLEGFIWVGVGNVLFVLATIRFIKRLLIDYGTGTQTIFSRIEKSYLIVNITFVILIGILPQVFSTNVLTLLQAFPNLK
jgi:NADH-quinone oxidoreductase subunit N